MTDPKVELAGRLDSVIHPIPRLKICAILHPVSEEEFAEIRDLLGMSDSALSKQLSVLADAGYIAYRRAILRGRRRVWVRLTPQGRVIFRDHLKAISTMVSTDG